ncbi:uncharacterized protein HD556DRAFT_1309061 [Suillus plorans]|uniref:DhaK domain-containing protein n=1 Tax=Suillus plorans TaxID=116603 RepID=A0A9P7AMY8_9AGAM|nr:uncharacterized protein HD556DRAFT_1309061 [Suillus plorans]KAG1792764.1 hypothetical protein HD556DRAFT_1309061 [Suillus plorans]
MSAVAILSTKALVTSLLRLTIVSNSLWRLPYLTDTYTSLLMVSFATRSVTCCNQDSGPRRPPVYASPLTQHPPSRDAFASPSANRNVAAIEFAAFANGLTHRDVVVVTNNYTGDRLNFGLAMEHARAKHAGLKVVSITVLNADDVLHVHQANQDGKAVRQSVSEVSEETYVCKVLDVYTTPGGKGASRPSPTRSHAKCLGDVLVAHLHSIAFQLVADGHVEVGLGLHIEPGVRRAPLESSRWFATGMLCLASYMAENGTEQRSTRVKNNLDGVSQLEIGAVVEEVRGVPESPAEDEAQVEALLRTFTSPSRISQSSSDGGSTSQGLAILAALDYGMLDSVRIVPAAFVSKVGVRYWKGGAAGARAPLQDAVVAVEEGADRSEDPGNEETIDKDGHCINIQVTFKTTRLSPARDIIAGAAAAPLSVTAMIHTFNLMPLYLWTYKSSYGTSCTNLLYEPSAILATSLPCMDRL